MLAPKKLPPMLDGGLPLLGHASEKMKDRGGLCRRGYHALGDVFAIKLGPQRAVVLGGKTLTREVYTQTDKQLATYLDFVLQELTEHGAVGQSLSPSSLSKMPHLYWAIDRCRASSRPLTCRFPLSNRKPSLGC